jgi:hypothetical protein
MAEIVGSLFGVTPDMYERQQRQSALNEGIAMARLAPEDRAQAIIYSGAAGLGRAGGGLLGAEDPQLQRITQQDQLLRGLNLRDPQSLEQAAVQANQMGNTPLAFKLLELADNAQVRAQQAQTQRQTSLAQLVAQRAYQPGTAERPQMLDVQEQQQMADQGTPMPENIAATAPSYDIRRVAPQLQALGAPGLAQLKLAEAAAAVGRPEYKEAGGVLYEIPKFGDAGPRPVTQQARKTITIGNRVLDANTMAVLFTAPDATPAAIAEWKAFQGLPKDQQKSFLELQTAKRPSTTVKNEIPLGDVLQKVFQSKEREDSAKAFGQAGEAYTITVPLIKKLGDVESTVSNAFTGAGQNYKLALSKGLSAFGVKISDRATDTEFGDAISAQVVQQIAKVFPGSQSNKELDQLLKSKFNLQQELPTILRLVGEIKDEMLAQTKTYEQMANLPANERTNFNAKLAQGQNYQKIQQYRNYEKKYLNKTITPEERAQAAKLKQELNF